MKRALVTILSIKHCQAETIVLGYSDPSSVCAEKGRDGHIRGKILLRWLALPVDMGVSRILKKMGAGTVMLLQG